MSNDLARLGEILRSRWFSIGLHAGLWLLVLLVVVQGNGLTGYTIPFLEKPATSPAAPLPVPVGKLEKLFVASPARKPAAAPTRPSFFETTHFVPRTPPPPPPSVPPPPPPTTWKLELTYQGYYRTGNGPKYAIVRIGDKLANIPEGGQVVTNLYVIDAAVRTLTLTNTAVQTNVLALNTRQVVEVPLK